ncbi:MAG: hypothetical protein FWC90_04905 [Oscillospiraceae bacterium]|nr:hypothetical protein [Oscillospiraceae bacterium]
MNCSEMIGIVAIILSPIIALYIGQKLQDNSAKRADKMKLLYVLMGSYEYLEKDEIAAFYTIPIVFHKSKDVMKQWNISKNIIESAASLAHKRGTSYNLLKFSPDALPPLIEAMAKDLKYKKITGDEIKRIQGLTRNQ